MNCSSVSPGKPTMISVAMEQSGIFAADLFHQLAIVLLGVAALHIGQHFIIAGLDGHFDVRHDLRKLGDRLHQFLGEIVRMRGQEADALDALDLMDDAQQRRQVGAIGNIFAVAVHDLTEQGDLP